MILPRKAAIIDMGTNTFHLLLVELNATDFTTLYKEKVAVKVGQGGISKNTITKDAQKRAFDTLQHFRGLIDREEIIDVFAFATSAVRNADNGSDFVQEIKEKFNINVNVIDGSQEAQLIYEGIRFSGSLNDENHLMMDIGGGSVEFIIGNNHEAHWKQSFEIGGQRLLDLFHYHDPIIEEEKNNLTQFLEEKLIDLITAINKYRPTKLVGASGTFDTLSDIYYASHDLKKEDSEQTFLLPRSGFELIAEQLLTLNKAERLNIPGMISMRVDMIVVASCLISFILNYINTDTLICSSYALKEGVISRLTGNNSIADHS